ncbi:hypothetical protein GOP47_0027076 [Adiantum capillus-veneris]|nr:hypothetical protein GOP47_0027076 [Adiantum capillus-veneris]
MEGISSAVKRALKNTCGMVPVPEDLENFSEEDVKHMKKRQLQQILKRLGLPRTGNVADLQDRVLNHNKSGGLRVQKVSTDVTGSQSKSGKDSAGTSALMGKVENREAKKGDDAIDDQGDVADVKTMKYSAVEGSRSKKRKKWRITDPAQIAPNFYHRDLFVANFPLVNVVDVPRGCKFPVRDKFEGNVLDAEETLHARKRWIRRFLDVEQTYRKAETEQQAFPIHFAFMESMKQFTKPSREQVARHNDICVSLKRKWSYDEIKGGGKRRKLDDQNEENVGFCIVPDTEEIQGPLGANRSDGDNEGIEIVAEEAVELTGNLQEDGDAATGFADGVIHVDDERPLQRVVPNSKTIINSDRVACVLECKFVDDKHKWNARFQGGFYAAKHCMANIEKGHGVPIYVLIMTASTWSYGILVPEGYVHVRDGKIDLRSIPRFHRHQEITGVAETSLEDLQAKLQEGTEFYRKNYLDNPLAKYADGPMLVGTFYLSSQWFDLPKAHTHNGKVPGVRRLFDGLMRVVLGDFVLDMTAADYMQRWQLREQWLEEEVEEWYGLEAETD